MAQKLKVVDKFKTNQVLFKMIDESSSKASMKNKKF